MDKKELEELGFEKCGYNLELEITDDCSLQLWEGEDFITICNSLNIIDLYNVNTIEKVKQLIKLLK